MSRATFVILPAIAFGLVSGCGSSKSPEVVSGRDPAPGKPGDPLKPAAPASVATQYPTRTETGESVTLVPASRETMVGKTVPALATALKDTDGWVRRFACWELGSRGAAAKEALPALREYLKSPRPHDRFDAAETILLIDPSEAEPVEVLLDLLKKDASFRESPWYAASALAIVPAQAETALPVLMKSLDEPPAWIRLMAITGIGRLGPQKGAPAVEKLRAIARSDSDESTRLKAAETLAKLVGEPNELP